MGVGVGALFNGDSGYVWTASGEGSSRREEALDLAITQEARLGALDGLNVTVRNAFSLDARSDRWQFGFTEVMARAALGHRTWLLAGGARRLAGQNCWEANVQGCQLHDRDELGLHLGVPFEQIVARR